MTQLSLSLGLPCAGTFMQMLGSLAWPVSRVVQKLHLTQSEGKGRGAGEASCPATGQEDLAK